MVKVKGTVVIVVNLLDDETLDTAYMMVVYGGCWCMTTNGGKRTIHGQFARLSTGVSLVENWINLSKWLS